jgi:phosphatidylglycerophosphatase A
MRTHLTHTPAGDEARELCRRLLQLRGVAVEDIAELVHTLQLRYVPGLDRAECLESVLAVLGKREVCHAVLTGIALDELAERGALPEPLQSTLLRDDPLYGIDEVLALSVVNIYGSIGFTNFGYLDKMKPGIIGRIERSGHAPGRCNTFLDDLISAIAAAAAARIAHNHRDTVSAAAPEAPARSAEGPLPPRAAGAGS